MQANLGDLLEEINNAPTGREHEFNSLVEVFINKGVPRNEIEALIDEAWKNLLIKDKSYPVKETQKDDVHAPTGKHFILNIPGFELLNQIQINKAIVKFNESSDKSYKEIIDLTGKLGLSVEKLYKSSEWLDHLTRVLIVLTFFLAGLTISDFYLKHPSIETFLFIIFILIVGICAAFADKIVALLRKRRGKF